MIEELIAILRSSEKLSELTAEQFTDIFWLAIQQSRFSGLNNQEVARNPSQNFTLPVVEDKPEIADVQPPTQPSFNSQELSTPSKDLQPKADIYAQTASTINNQESNEVGKLPIRVPDAAALPKKLELARSLKPLMRRVPDLYDTVLDEVATTERVATEQLWIPVLKPAQELWLELDLVVDEGASMLIWKNTIKELRQLLETLGAFRNVRTWSLLSNNETEVQIRPGIGSAARQQYARSPRELVDPNGRRLILILSDCVSPLWRNGVQNGVKNENMIFALNTWANSSPVAIVQMLPKWLWARTALGLASAVQLSGQAPGVTNQQLQVRQLSLWDEIDQSQNIKVPVLTLEPEMVATWSQMLAGMGTVWTSGVVFQSQVKNLNNADELDESTTELTPKQRYQRFRLTASPMARRLAGLIAVAPVVTLPVIRLIQQTMLSQPSQVHVAEVLLGGLVKLKPETKMAPDTNPNEVEFQFIHGVDEILLDSLPVTDKVIVKYNLLEQLTQHIADRIGLSTDTFAGFLQDPRQISSITQQLNPIARLAIQKLRNLGGRYTDFAEQLEIANQKTELLECLKHENLDVASVLQQIKANFPQITTSESEKILKDLLITQKINNPFVEKFGAGQGNRFLTKNLVLNDESNQIFLNQGGQINATMEINHDCPECGTSINQIIVGIAGEDEAQACVWIGGSTSNSWQPVSFSLNIPYTPGVYYIRTRYAQAYNSEDALGWWKVDRPDGPTEEANIGAIVVGVNHIFEYAGEYTCAVKWGGESGTWHEDTEQLFISPQGKVQFRSRFALSVIQNFKVEGLTLSWSFDENQTAASITFKENSENSYFWESKQTGKLFEGWLNYPNEGRIDFRGKFITNQETISSSPMLQSELQHTTIESDTATPTGLALQSFEFEVATIIEINESKILSATNPIEIADSIVFSKTEKHLSEPEKLVIQGAISNQTYEQIAASTKYSKLYLKNIANKLWGFLSEVIGEKVSKTNLKNVIQQQKNYSQINIHRSLRQAQCFIEDLENGIQLEMVAIPEGSFIMGSPTDELERNEDENPQHTVTIKPFFFGKYQVTQAQWQAVASLPQLKRKLNPDPSRFKSMNRPVEQVSWYDAVEFCDRLSKYTGKPYHLPSEAEWEYACRSGTTTPFHFGETITSKLANYNANFTYGTGVKGTYRKETTEVGSFGVANAFGLYDMHGNVWEWCQDDWHDDYEGAPTDGSAWFDDKNNFSQEEEKAVLRGGSWSILPRSCRSASRINIPKNQTKYLNYFFSFRVSCSI
ncbi:SUMF1/EgtB/PvdO family nonheme iron enzyme [Nostoc sp. XA010]|uniref:SAV_2336 N-terminal domain-related protein n=1 Tax=Nostoc sp. XA010 TaxID=2780407 RepID=UPI001E360588|nr:SAV_2336 N-terminal domain-related protein [Nostoc sp. XA010]MCC5659177.1 SUMF1/EgtB/PvdO family nonheme iron enzyme [Nostoc sp. XA010]